MNMLELARRRYTAKHYDPAKKISEKDLATILEVLRLAPSSINIQPWHFYVFDSASIPKLMPFVKDFNLERVGNASHVIVFAIEKNLRDPAYLEKLLAKEGADGRFEPGFDFTGLLRIRTAAVAEYCATQASSDRWASEQAHIALGFLMPVLGALGIDSTILGGLYFEQLDRAMGWDKEGRASVVGLSLGYRAATDANAARPKSRFPLEDIVTRVVP